MTNDRKDESAKKPGEVTTHSINEPGPGAPPPFKAPEDHTATTPETLERDYPDGYVAPESPEKTGQEKPARAFTADNPSNTDDPDDLEDEIDQAEEEGDFKSIHKSPPKSPTKRK